MTDYGTIQANPVLKRMYELASVRFGAGVIKHVVVREIVPDKKYAWDLFENRTDAVPFETIVLDVDSARERQIEDEVLMHLDRQGGVAGRTEQRFHEHFVSSQGPILHRNAVAVAMMELEDPWLLDITREFSAQQQPIFLMAYQCFVLWAVKRAVQPRFPSAEVEEIIRRVREKFAGFDYYTPSVFEKIWPLMQESMPGCTYPLPLIIQSAISAGYPLPIPQKVINYRVGVYALVVIKRIADILTPDPSPEP